MSEGIRAHLRANVVGYVAIFLFAVGGTAYATHPGGANTISTADIINGQVMTVDLADEAVNSVKLRDGVVASRHMVTNSLNGGDVADTGSLGPAEIGELGGADIADGSLTTSDYEYASGTTAIDFPEIAGQSCGSSNLISVPPGASNDPVVVTPSDSWISVQASMTYNTRLVGGIFNAFRIQLCNLTSSPIDPPSITFHWTMLDRP